MEAAVAAELPTAPISHLQQARWFHTGGPWTWMQEQTRARNMDSIRLLMCADPGPIHEPAVRRPRNNRLDLDELTPHLNERRQERNIFFFSFTQSDSLVFGRFGRA